MRDESVDDSSEEQGEGVPRIRSVATRLIIERNAVVEEEEDEASTRFFKRVVFNHFDQFL